MHALTTKSAAFVAALAAAMAANAAAPRKAAVQDAIYRCPDPESGSVLYTNEPCKEGTRLDILPGRADPAAIEKLRRDEEAWQRRQEAREAREFEREMRVAAMPPFAPAMPYAAPADANVYFPAYFPGYGGYEAPQARADRGRWPGWRPPHVSRSVVPAHPRNPAVPPK